MILLFVLLPSLAHTAFFRDHHDCFLAQFRLLCGSEDYYGPVNVALWDDNLELLGGDEKIVSRDILVTKKGQTVRIRDVRDRGDCWFYEPYIVFTTLCKNPSSTIADPFTIVSFKNKFDEFDSRVAENLVPIYSACRNMPQERAPREFHDTVIQLAEEDDCKRES